MCNLATQDGASVSVSCRRRIDDENPVHPVERYKLDSPIDKRLGKITIDWLV
jgi:hypothetical protein